eukprot:PhM_4_TR14642/c0_g1_i1/m.62165
MCTVDDDVGAGADFDGHRELGRGVLDHEGVGEGVGNVGAEERVVRQAEVQVLVLVDDEVRGAVETQDNSVVGLVDALNVLEDVAPGARCLRTGRGIALAARGFDERPHGVETAALNVGAGALGVVKGAEASTVCATGRHGVGVLGRGAAVGEEVVARGLVVAGLEAQDELPRAVAVVVGTDFRADALARRHNVGLELGGVVGEHLLRCGEVHDADGLVGPDVHLRRGLNGAERAAEEVLGDGERDSLHLSDVVLVILVEAHVHNVVELAVAPDVVERPHVGLVEALAVDLAGEVLLLQRALGVDDAVALGLAAVHALVPVGDLVGDVREEALQEEVREAVLLAAADLGAEPVVVHSDGHDLAAATHITLADGRALER